MARPQKTGLEYFPMDVDFFNDEKIQFISARFEERGELIAVKLLCKVYRNGYYLPWNEDMALLFAKSEGKTITLGLVNDVVNELLKRGFFSRAIHMRFSVLTSNGIQKRYEKICKAAGRTAEIKPEFRVSQQETPINSEETGVSPPDNSTKESKGKERKVNGANAPARARGKAIQSFEDGQAELKTEFKHLEIPEDRKAAWDLIKKWINEKKPAFVDPYVVAWNVFASFYNFPAVKKINDDMRKHFNTRIKDESFQFFEILARSKSSEYLKTSSWFNFRWLIKNETNFLKVLEGNFK